MPSKAEQVNPSVTRKLVKKLVFDPDPNDTIAITRTEVTRINGSTPNSQPDWISFSPQSQVRRNARAEKPVEVTLDITGLRLNSVFSFEFEIEASDGKTTSVFTYRNVVDDLTSTGRYRLSWLDQDTLVLKSQDLAKGSTPYQVNKYFLKRDDSDNLTGPTYKRQMNGAIEIDPDLGIWFVKHVYEDSFDDHGRIYRYRVGGNGSFGGDIAVPNGDETGAWDIDKENEHIYFTNIREDNFGIQRQTYDGQNNTQIANNFSTGAVATGAVDMDIDSQSDSMLIVGDYMLALDYAIIKTSLSNPDNDIDERVPRDASNLDRSNVDEPVVGENPETVRCVDVDWQNGHVFTIETNGKYLVRRDLGTLAVEQAHSTGVETVEVWGLAAAPAESRIYFAREDELRSAPYGDISNVRVERTDYAGFPVYSEPELINAVPRPDDKQDVEWRK